MENHFKWWDNLTGKEKKLMTYKHYTTLLQVFEPEIESMYLFEVNPHKQINNG